MLQTHYLLENPLKNTPAELPVFDLLEETPEFSQTGASHKLLERRKQLRVFPGLMGPKHADKLSACSYDVGVPDSVCQAICGCMPQNNARQHSADPVLLLQRLQEARLT